jgi:hypothetical protein
LKTPADEDGRRSADRCRGDGCRYAPRARADARDTVTPLEVLTVAKRLLDGLTSFGDNGLAL